MLAMPKVRQTEEDLEEHLREQLEFLQTSADNYDSGNESESKRMALHIRTLLHDTFNKDGTPRSQSLLSQLGKKESLNFLDTSSSEEGLIGSYTGLVLQSIGPTGGRYVAPLDDLPPTQIPEQVSFQDYWNGDIFVDNNSNRFSRKALVLAMANKDGGAHIDPELDQDYVELTKNNSLGWIYGNDLQSGPLENASSAAVRQITHEILKTLIPDYPEKKLLNQGDGIVMGGIHLSGNFMAGKLIQKVKTEPLVSDKTGRNDKCPCGSERKYKRCHGS